MAGLKFKVVLEDKSEVEIVAMNLDDAVEHADLFYPTWVDIRNI